MKNNKTFIKKWKLNGLPYPAAELQDGYLLKKLENGAQVWLTDDPEKAQQLLAEGECCLWLLTVENRNEACGGIEWCAEVPEEEEGEEPAERGSQDGVRDEARESAAGWRRQLIAAETAGLPDWLPEDFLWRVWLRSRRLPWHICETDRLALREMTEADLDFCYEMQEDEETAKFLDRLNGDREEERQKLTAYCREMYGFYGFGIWLVLEKESGRPVGRAGLQMRDGFEEPELGFAVLKKYRGRGYAEEACRAVLRYAEEELEQKRVRAVVDRENTKSQRLCEKLGFAVDNTAETDGRLCIFYSRGKIFLPLLDEDPKTAEIL